jgi:hypothetical protein
MSFINCLYSAVTLAVVTASLVRQQVATATNGRASALISPVPAPCCLRPEAKRLANDVFFCFSSVAENPNVFSSPLSSPVRV